MNNKLLNKIEQIQKEIDFSGSVHVKKGQTVLVQSGVGFANRAEEIKNEANTRYGIASGCKIFTAVAIAQLVEARKISFDTKLSECIDISFPHFHNDITIHHLLTHTSGIPDYFDEELMDDFEELWIDKPMYHMRRLEDFLPLFQNALMKFSPGERFHYNNAGFIVLGLIVEKMSGLVFTEYVQKHIFDKAGMSDSGYFALDSLPGKTAIGYIDREDGTWKTNVYSLPAIGGSDGGAFVTVGDMVTFWETLMNGELLSETTTKKLLVPYVQSADSDYYGYGVWIEKKENVIYKYHVMGYDPGVSFHSSYYPASDLKIVVCANKSNGAYSVFKEIEKSC